MQVLLAFLIVCFLLGASDRGRFVRKHPAALAAFCFVVAASFYRLGTVL